MAEKRQIVIINMTNFFNRELFMYAIGDYKFSKPKSLKYIGYTALFFAIWVLPFIILLKFTIISNPYLAMLVFVPPFVLGYYASQPIWGGRGMIDFIKVYAKYLSEPKAWADYNAFNPDAESYYVKHPIWIGRRREYQHLAELKEKRLKARKAQNNK